MASHHYLACDLGAESGRLMCGTLSEDPPSLRLEEIHRFPNTPVRAHGSLHWNVRELFEQLRLGLEKAATLKRSLGGISTDSWGLDYVLLDAEGRVMEPAFHYRDPRTRRGMERVHARMDPAALYRETGIQIMPFNTLYQLAAEPPERLAAADRLVLIGDAFNFHLSGVARSEVSLASTSQLYNPVTRDWSSTLLETFNLPARLLPPIVPSGTPLGPLRPELARATGLGPVPVLASCSHDTGAAVAAVPASDGHWGYISSGTWSLMGVECGAPVLTETSRRLNFTNEVGYGGTIRLLKNIIGLWLVQECRRAWASAGRPLDYDALTEMASKAAPFQSLIDPEDPRFIPPGDMPVRIRECCRETGEPEPDSEGALVRCILESLAFLYRRTARQLGELTGRPLERVHIIGGGSRNALLNQFTANALGIQVWAGPVEATAMGNMLVQALAQGHLRSLPDARQRVEASGGLRVFEPEQTALWDQAHERFESLCRARRIREADA